MTLHVLYYSSPTHLSLTSTVALLKLRRNTVCDDCTPTAVCVCVCATSRSSTSTLHDPACSVLIQPNALVFDVDDGATQVPMRSTVCNDRTPNAVRVCVCTTSRSIMCVCVCVRRPALACRRSATLHVLYYSSPTQWSLMSTVALLTSRRKKVCNDRTPNVVCVYVA
jgi:hypothetical protein